MTFFSVQLLKKRCFLITSNSDELSTLPFWVEKLPLFQKGKKRRGFRWLAFSKDHNGPEVFFGPDVGIKKILPIWGGANNV